MSKRIGEMLLEKGLINRQQLAGALRSQLFFGGELGTSLIELGFVSEHDLGETLAEMHRTRHAPYPMLQELSEDVIELISAEQAEKYKVVPLKKEDRTLHVAVADPTRLSALSRLTGCKIVPWTCPETGITRALERYYGIPRPSRHVRILSDLDRNLRARAPLAQAENPAHAGTSAADGEPAAEATPMLSPGGAEADFGEQFGYGKSWREVLEEVIEDEDVSWDGPAEETSAAPVAPSQSAPTTLRDVAERLSNVETKEQLARVALEFVGRSCQRCILFRVKGETAHVWDAIGLSHANEPPRGIGFPLTAGSIFTLLLGESHFAGPLEEPERFEWFYTTLGIKPPRELLLVPAYVNDHLVAVLYADNGKRGRVSGDVDDYVQLGHKIGLALNMLVLKMRILS